MSGKTRVKFRVFADGEMYTPEDPGQFMLNLSGDLLIGDSHGACFARIGFTDMHLMQWTGLTDKNGKEIYEGDIVRISESDRKLFDVVGSDGSGVAKHVLVGFKHGCFMVGRNPTYPDHLNTYLWITLSASGDGAEVIGNIHQNSELLK